MCWVPRAVADLAAKTVTRNKVTIKFNSLDKMFQLQRNTAIRKICLASVGLADCLISTMAVAWLDMLTLQFILKNKEPIIAKTCLKKSQLRFRGENEQM